MITQARPHAPVAPAAATKYDAVVHLCGRGRQNRHFTRARTREGLANAYLAVGNLSRAAELAAEAHREHEWAHDDRELATVLDTEARIRLATGDTDGAIGLATRAFEVAGAADNRKALIDARVTIARATAQAGLPDDALDHYERALGELREHGPDARLAAVLGELAELVAGRGEHKKAYELSREALRRSVV